MIPMLVFSSCGGAIPSNGGAGTFAPHSFQGHYHNQILISMIKEDKCICSIKLRSIDEDSSVILGKTH
ncbi:unnamed protein product [Spirodela intermedia]|uniref:Uncharacterized protein n=1 Tax=Spirodela intermedia TaxID=51605 RepID=A0A7I8L484_SPIIN|nr:unnamed protein product [Spirodela intermedia]